MTTFIEVLNNPETRRMVDAIEDTISSLKSYNYQEPTLQDILAAQIQELKDASGYEYIVSALTE